MGYYGYGTGWGIMAFIWTILWWIIVVGGIILVVRWIRDGHHPHWRGDHYHHGRSALDILRERYAKGEIDKGEYEEKKKDLEE